MNRIQLNNISKKFGRQHIFSGITYEIQHGCHQAIIGYNGSGKSTLLQIMAGYVSPSSGEVDHYVDGKKLQQEQLYKYISFSSPYLELIEEYTASETIDFYSRFKPFHSQIDRNEVLEIAKLTHARNKQVKFFSSGMKQRLKLVLALLSDVAFVFLDEPAANLDKPGIAWYHEMITGYAASKILIISSNEMKQEIEFCHQVLRVEDFKKG